MADRFDTVVRGGQPYVRRARLTAGERGEHGTLAGYADGCRCPSCRRARAGYDRVRRAARTVAEGRRAVVWKVPTDRARRRVAELRGRGWSVARIAQAAGVSPTTVWRVLRAKRCWSTVAEAIVAVS